MRVKWHGHASFEVESQGFVVHVDPRTFRGQAKKADLVLVTHAHESHFDVEGIRAVAKPDALLAGPASAVRGVFGHAHLRDVEPGDVFDHGRFTVHVTHAFHPEGDYHPQSEGVGYVVEAEGRRLYHAGDTGIHHGMHFLEDIDVALVPIGGLFNLSMHEAVSATKLINPDIVVPMHYGRNDYYPTDPHRFKQLVEADTHARVEILEHGELYV